MASETLILIKDNLYFYNTQLVGYLGDFKILPL